jgi:pimeloyl-ACP methyl ester carboxylesterase
MKKISALLLAVFTSSACVSQTLPSSPLCQGSYYTEAQGAAQLAKVTASLKTLTDWTAHADSMRAQIKKGLNLEKLPARSPFNAKSRNKKQLDGYTVEAVIFESFPGFYVTGNLYRPTGDHKRQSLAVIACPHGHWDKAEDYGRFRNDMQIRCAAFARMGAIVFSYDMIGYGESQQLDHEYVNNLTLQTWNTMRVIDYLLSFPEADPDRVAVTGASGGGTQTFLAAALDERVKVSVPVVMVSAHFFGGCVCESGLPIHRTGEKVFSNVEIACLAAPRPMLLVSDGDDWTKNNPKVEYPFAQKVYDLYDSKNKVELAHFADEKHDYGKSKRLAVYPFLSKHLGLDMKKITNQSGVIDESFVTIVDRKSLEYFLPGETAAFRKGEDVYKLFVNGITGHSH